MKNNLKKIAMIVSYPIAIVATYFITKESIPISTCELNQRQFNTTRENAYFDNKLGYNITIEKKGVVSEIEIYNEEFSLSAIFVKGEIKNIQYNMLKEGEVPKEVKNLEKFLDSLFQEKTGKK